MDLISWSLSAIDNIFSTRSSGVGEPACPEGTFAAVYVRDSWDTWRPLCLAMLSVEDIEDIWIIAIMVFCSLLMGLGIGLIYRQNKTGAALNKAQKLPELIADVNKTAIGKNSVSAELFRRQEKILESLAALRAGDLETQRH